MASKRATIFGGSGFLGHHIVKHLAAEGTSVRAAVRHPPSAHPSLNGSVETARLSSYTPTYGTKKRLPGR